MLQDTNNLRSNQEKHFYVARSGHTKIATESKYNLWETGEVMSWQDQREYIFFSSLARGIKQQTKHFAS